MLERAAGFASAVFRIHDVHQLGKSLDFGELDSTELVEVGRVPGSTRRLVQS
jgi:hypothetical protein